MTGKLIIDRITSGQELSAMYHGFAMDALERGVLGSAVYFQLQQRNYSAEARRLLDSVNEAKISTDPEGFTDEDFDAEFDDANEEPDDDGEVGNVYNLPSMRQSIMEDR